MGASLPDQGEGAVPGGIAWHDWDAGAFARAAAERKLVFLDISASWCHWCHVLDATSLSDPRVVRVLNDWFVPVRVDTDRRPDVNDRYNQGGWPTTAILLPDGRLLTGATYLPPDALLELLRKCADFYARELSGGGRSLAGTAGPESGEELPGLADLPAAPHPGDAALVKHAVLAQYDPAHPGFFREPKFPHAPALAFLRDAWLLASDEEAGETFLDILRAMGRSEVVDPVDGGVFRYATQRDWSAPHYEKLLSDNAEMLPLFAVAAARSGDAGLARVAEGIRRFLFAALYDERSGAFFASRDADEAYYRLPPAERRGRAVPAEDRTLFSEYNAKAVSGLVAAARAVPEPADAGTPAAASLVAAAERLGGFLHRALWRREDGQLRFAEGGSSQAGHLADNAAAALAHLDLFDATGEAAHLRRAADVLDWTVRHLYSAKSYGFLDRRPAELSDGPLRGILVPFAENARMAGALIRYAREAVRTDLMAVAEQVLKRLSAETSRLGFFAAPYGSALLLYRKGVRRAGCLRGDRSCGDR